MTDPIDRIVKGAPPPDVSAEQLAANAKGLPSTHSVTAPLPPSTHNVSHDPRDTLPSSPTQIYLNLLIQESQFRKEYIALRSRLRLHLLLLVVLAAWTLQFTYLLFFRPREDGSGVGGSVYWVLESAEKLGWCSGVVTLCLFWGTGMYDRGVREPRKYISTANRGLRVFNLKVVVVKGSFLSEVKGWIAMLDPLGWFREERINYQVVPKDIETITSKEHWNSHAARHGLIEEDIAPGGDVLRVLFLPKPFSPDFREGWDTYWSEFWERENARREVLRSVVRTRQREVSRRDGGWLWWTGWRGWRNFRLGFFLGRESRRQIELKKLALKEKPVAERVKERRRHSVLMRDGSHSRNSSHSRPSTPDDEVRQLRRERRGSSAHSSASTGTRRPRKPPVNEKSRLSATETLLHSSGDFSASASFPTRHTGSIDEHVKKEEDPPIKIEATLADEIKAEPDEP